MRRYGAQGITHHFDLTNASLDQSVLKYRRRGFTIVELLIVIVVIAILAAITAVAYSGIQNRARASGAQAAARQAASSIAAYAVQNADQYPSTAAAAGLPDSASTTYQYRVDNSASPRIESERTEINDTLYVWQARQRHAATDHLADKMKRASRTSAEGSLTSTSTGLKESNGLSNSIMVGMTGFEPATP